VRNGNDTAKSEKQQPATHAHTHSHPGQAAEMKTKTHFCQIKLKCAPRLVAASKWVKSKMPLSNMCVCCRCVFMCVCVSVCISMLAS